MARPIPLAEFYLDAREPESRRQREQRHNAMRDIRHLFERERSNGRRDRIRAIAVHRAKPRARASHRRVTAATPPSSGSSDDDGEGPPRRYERALVATVRPDGSPCEVIVEIDPLHIDPTALVWAARRAAGHSLASAATGLDDVRWRAIHPHRAGGAA